jgi:hypothetical protein
MEVDWRTGGEGLPDGFVEVARAAFADEPQWIPEDPESVLAAFGPGNAWFQRGQARTFCVPGKARLAAFFDPAMQVDEQPIGAFGYWATIGDHEADRAVFEAAESWLREQGASAIYGPINFSTYSEYRLRLSAEPDAVTFPGEPFNPADYPARLEALGYTLDQTYFTQRSTTAMMLPVMEAREDELREVEAAGYQVGPLSHETWLEHLGELYGLVDAMFSQNFAYTPLSQEQFEAYCGESFIRRACPHASSVVWGPDGDLAGFFLIYPHYGPLVVQAAGDARLSPGVLNYADHFDLLRPLGPVGAICKTVGVAPNHRSHGLMTSMATSMFLRSSELYEWWYGALIRSGNRSGNYSEAATMMHRWYGLYRK